MLPLPDLHRHLDGSLRYETVLSLASALGVQVPNELRFFAGMGLEAALSRFAFTLSLLQSEAAVRRVAAEIVEDARAEGVTTLEVRFAPQLHGRAGVERIVDAALDGLGGHAGLILCGLYGEAPEVLEALVSVAIPRRGVVGIDLAGGPLPAHRWTIEDYAPAFIRAGKAGLGRTVHAGEGRPASEIRKAITMLGADRIGHGTTLLDDPAVVDLVVASGTTLEACPTSNVHTGIFASTAEHPLPRWLRSGVRVCVNPDNTLFSDVTAREEHQRASEIPGMNEAHISRCIADGHAARFVRG